MRGSGTRLIAASTGVTGYDVAETAQNLAVNMAAVVGLTVFYFNDKRARDLDLERIASSGKLSTLSIRLKSESGKEVHNACRARALAHMPRVAAVQNQDKTKTAYK